MLVCATFNVKVYAIKDRITQGGTKMTDPLINCSISMSQHLGIRDWEKVVAACTATNGEHDLDATTLAPLDVTAKACATTICRVTVACQVEHRRLTIAKGCQECQVDKLVVAGGAGVDQCALAAILTPVYGNATSLLPNNLRKQQLQSTTVVPAMIQLLCVVIALSCLQWWLLCFVLWDSEARFALYIRWIRGVKLVTAIIDYDPTWPFGKLDCNFFWLSEIGEQIWTDSAGNFRVQMNVNVILIWLRWNVTPMKNPSVVQK
jgi:hypothetical protein